MSFPSTYHGAGSEDQDRHAPHVSVVLPTRDRPVEVRRAAATVIAQTFTDWELLIVDDGSDPAADVTGLKALDDRIAVLRNEAPTGVSRARNRGIATARGTWIAFLDDDDLWHPGKLAAQLAAAERTDAGFVYTASTIVESGYRRVYVQESAAEDEHRREMIRANVVRAPSCVLVRADVLAQTSGFDPEMSVVADWDLWLRLGERAHATAVPEPMTCVIEHPGSMQLTLADEIGAELERLHERHDASAREYGVALGSPTVRRWHAHMLWTAHRTPLRAAAYGWAVLRCNGIGGTLRKTTQHRKWRQADAPEWVRTQLDAPVILPVGVAPEPGAFPAPAAHAV